MFTHWLPPEWLCLLSIDVMYIEQYAFLEFKLDAHISSNVCADWQLGPSNAVVFFTFYCEPMVLCFMYS